MLWLVSGLAEFGTAIYRFASELTQPVITKKSNAIRVLFARTELYSTSD